MLRIIMDFGVLEFAGLTVPLRIYGYGLMLVLGFLLSILIGQRLARRAGESPDVLANCGILALIAGVAGARAAYVAENWSTEFAGRGNILAEVANISSGGLIYYGGVAMATVAVLIYLHRMKLPIRRYLDILAPCLMIGLAFGRAGCLLNGCCQGARCDEHWPLATTFPMFSKPLVNLNADAGGFSPESGHSPTYVQQVMNMEITPDARLYSTTGMLTPGRMHGKLDSDQLVMAFANEKTVSEKFGELAGGDRMISLSEWLTAAIDENSLLTESDQWGDAVAFDVSGDGLLSLREMQGYLNDKRNRVMRQFGGDRDQANAYLQADLFALASSARTLAVKPAQLLGLINALLLAVLLTGFYRLRRREGRVFAMLMIIYPITRFILEDIRADERAQWFFTHNQYTSLVMIFAGVVFWTALRWAPASAGPTWAQREKKLKLEH